jgi:hypothetical protein
MVEEMITTMVLVEVKEADKVLVVEVDVVDEHIFLIARK